MRKGRCDMKRIYNKIPLGSVLSVISGLQKIRVLNGEYDMTECIFNGLVKDTHGFEFVKMEYSELHGIELDGDTIVFRINNKYEEF